MTTPATRPDRSGVLDLLSEILAIGRGGSRLYRAALEQAPADVRERLQEYADEADRHVTLTASAVSELGGDPEYRSPEARLLDEVSDDGLRRSRASNRPLFYLVERLLIYEIRDSVIEDVLAQAAASIDDAEVADVLKRAVLPVATGATAAAHDTTTHQARLEWLQSAMRAIVLAEYGLKPPSRWQRLLRW